MPQLGEAVSNPFIATLAKGAGMVGEIWRHPGNRNGRTLGLARFLGWQFVKHVLKRPVVIGFHNMRLKCYPDSTSTSSALYFGGMPDYWEMKFLQSYFRPGDNFLDIGANVGIYSILASGYIGAAGNIDAFEPVDRTAERIEEQAALNGLVNLSVHRFAVSDQDGQLEFGYSSNDAMMHMRRTGEQAQGKTQVPSIKLDTFEPYRQYAIGKMDIEGAEPLALAGAAARLQQGNPPVWLLEFAGYSTYYGVPGHEVVQRLEDSGYDCAVFNPDLNRLEYTRTPWLLGVQNVLAVSRRHRGDVEQRLQQNAIPS